MNKNVLNVLPQVVKELNEMGISVELSPQTDDYNAFSGVLLNSKQYLEANYEEQLSMILDTENFDGNLSNEYLEELVSIEPSDLDRLIEAEKIVPRAENIKFIVENINLFNHINILSKLSPLSIKEEDLDMIISSNPELRSLPMLRMSGKEICIELENILQEVLNNDGFNDEQKEMSKSEVIALIPPKEGVFEEIIEHLANDDYEYEFSVDRLLMYAVSQVVDKSVVVKNQNNLETKVPDTKGAISKYIVENRLATDLPTKIKHNLVELEDLKQDNFYEVFESVVRGENTTIEDLHNIAHYTVGSITVASGREEIERLILDRFTQDDLNKLIVLGEGSNETMA